ncbi:hypothetical protein FGO68_gene10316 [Halteria grandinella]|uniref:protein-serine/threonine phosphatase n=1 Tax=Halteria grandinella TaxID=5974 RepID=A0A8J8P1F9_HALGN|nr:hypothetical protein FGO68_gene10316 [Halteria grandinella]
MMNQQQQKSSILQLGPPPQESTRRSMNHGSFIAALAEKHMRGLDGTATAGRDKKKSVEEAGVLDTNINNAQEKKKFQTLQLKSDYNEGQNDNDFLMQNGDTQREFQKRIKVSATIEQQSQRPVRASFERERPNSLVMKSYEQQNSIRQTLPKTRVSLDHSIFSQTNANSLKEGTTGIQKAYYQSLQKALVTEEIAKNEASKQNKTNPLLKTSKISHSAKDLFSNIKQSVKNIQNATVPTIQQQNENQSLTNKSPQMTITNGIFPHIEPSRISQKACGSVYAYATNTHDGLVRAYNEDYVAVVPDLRKPASLGGNYQSKKVSYFGLFDGHGGNICAQFLRDNLHVIISQNDNFPTNPEAALKQGFRQAEEEFMRQNQVKIKEKSGSCAIVVMIVDEMVYVANVGDSRAILSQNNGQLSQSLTVDHKPCEDRERKRILEAGGQLYQNYQIIAPDEPLNQDLGPIRVLPGRLSVSRTFGDAHAKVEHFGGNPKVESFHDFIIMGCDGIFDKLTTEQVIREAWKPLSNNSYLNQEQQTPILPGSGSIIQQQSAAAATKSNMDRDKHYHQLPQLSQSFNANSGLSLHQRRQRQLHFISRLPEYVRERENSKDRFAHYKKE